MVRSNEFLVDMTLLMYAAGECASSVVIEVYMCSLI